MLYVQPSLLLKRIDSDQISSTQVNALIVTHGPIIIATLGPPSLNKTAMISEQLQSSNSEEKKKCSHLKTK
jgi:hypothetical protein